MPDDTDRPDRFTNREQDWRQGAIVYQVFVDRFAPPADLDARRHLYPSPKVLRDWSETPRPGAYLPDLNLYQQEIEFWGGDLASLRTRLDYIQELGADVLYLNPIFRAYTNHKYDALDYQQISPEYGDRPAFIQLAADVHARGMKLVLDGVFNHMGRHAPIFQQAEQDPHSPYRDWFFFGAEYAGGACCWAGAQNLPELNLEHPAVQDYLYAAPDSVVRAYLRDGADGWRLDVAFELGYDFLRAITSAAHAEKPGSLVLGEIANYPDKWLQAHDGVLNFTLRHVILGLVSGRITPRLAGRMIDRLVRDAGLEPLLKSWVFLDNHDTPRLATLVPQERQRRLAQVLQFTLPGTVNLYYGGELGMSGGDDPQNRAPLRWDLVRADNQELAWIKKLIGLRKSRRALRVGDIRPVEAAQLLAFERYTDRALETVLVLANPAGTPVTERVLVGNAGLMDFTPLIDLLAPAGSPPVTEIQSGLLTVTVPPETALVLAPHDEVQGGYSRYKRIP